MKKFLPRVDDLIAHTINSKKGYQRLYRIVSIQLGGLKQEGAVELKPVDNAQHDIDGLGEINSYIPHMMFEQMVRTGILECLWRKDK